MKRFFRTDLQFTDFVRNLKTLYKKSRGEQRLILRIQLEDEPDPKPSNLALYKVPSYYKIINNKYKNLYLSLEEFYKNKNKPHFVKKIDRFERISVEKHLMLQLLNNISEIRIEFPNLRSKKQASHSEWANLKEMGQGFEYIQSKFLRKVGNMSLFSNFGQSSKHFKFDQNVCNTTKRGGKHDMIKSISKQIYSHRNADRSLEKSRLKSKLYENSGKKFFTKNRNNRKPAKKFKMDSKLNDEHSSFESQLSQSKNLEEGLFRIQSFKSLQKGVQELKKSHFLPVISPKNKKVEAASKPKYQNRGRPGPLKKRKRRGVHTNSLNLVANLNRRAADLGRNVLESKPKFKLNMKHVIEKKPNKENVILPFLSDKKTNQPWQVGESNRKREVELSTLNIKGFSNSQNPALQCSHLGAGSSIYNVTRLGKIIG